MITKKYALSLGCMALTMLLALVTTHVLSLFTLPVWVGAATGGVIFAMTLIVTLILRKHFAVHVAAIVLNAVGDGFAISSLFVYLGAFPRIWESAVALGALCAAFFLYALPAYIPLIRKHNVVFMITYVCLIVAGLVCGLIFSKSNIFTLALLGMIPFIAFFTTTAVKTENLIKHIRNTAYASFAALIIVIAVVLVIISDGDGIDGGIFLDGPSGAGKKAKKRRKTRGFGKGNR